MDINDNKPSFGSKAVVGIMGALTAVMLASAGAFAQAAPTATEATQDGIDAAKTEALSGASGYIGAGMAIFAVFLALWFGKRLFNRAKG